jgi:hypothetical protein
VGGGEGSIWVGAEDSPALGGTLSCAAPALVLLLALGRGPVACFGPQPRRSKCAAPLSCRARASSGGANHGHLHLLHRLPGAAGEPHRLSNSLGARSLATLHACTTALAVHEVRSCTVVLRTLHSQHAACSPHSAGRRVLQQVPPLQRLPGQVRTSRPRTAAGSHNPSTTLALRRTDASHCPDPSRHPSRCPYRLAAADPTHPAPHFSPRPFQLCSASPAVQALQALQALPRPHTLPTGWWARSPRPRAWSRWPATCASGRWPSPPSRLSSR